MPQAFEPLFCDRCSVELTLGHGEFYVVRIAAVADPTVKLDPSKYAENLRDQIAALVKQMNELSAQEALDHEYRNVTLYLCNKCYSGWIEKPLGDGS